MVCLGTICIDTLHKGDNDDDDNNNNNNNNKSPYSDAPVKHPGMPYLTSTNFESLLSVLKHPVAKCHCSCTVERRDFCALNQLTKSIPY
jgi:hypothetical protein